MFRSHVLTISCCSLMLLFVLTACGGTSGSVQSTGGSGTPVSDTANTAPEGGTGGEGSFTTYTDVRQKFSVRRPNTWIQDTATTNGAKFVGGDDVLTVEFPTTPGGTDLMTYAKNDASTFSKTLSGFKQVLLAPSTDVSNAVVLGFESSGTSAVTGKTYTARGDRYYIQLPDGRLATLTMNGPGNHYDREGIRDTTLSLKVMK